MTKIRQWYGFAFVFFLALTVRIWGLTARPIWFDEAFDYWSAAAPLREIPLAVLKTAGSPALYPYLLHFVLLFGQREWILRIPSVLFSLLGWLGVVHYSVRVWGTRAGLISGAVLAFLPVDVRYAQEAGEYALLTALLTWMIVFGLFALETGQWRYWIGAAVMGALSVHTHYGALAVIGGVGLAGVFEVLLNNKNEMRKFLLSLFIGVILCLPLLYFFPEQFHARSEFELNAFLTQITDLRSIFLSPAETLAFAFTGYPFTRIPTFLIYIFIYGFIAGAVWFYFRQKHWQTRRMLFWFWVSYIVYYLLVSLGLYARGGLGFRYANIFVPFLVWTAGAVISEAGKLFEAMPGRGKLAGRLFVGCLTGILLLVCGFSLPNRQISMKTRGQMPWPETQDLPKAIRYWKQHGGQKYPTYVYYGAIPAFRYYYRLYGGRDIATLPGDWITTCFHQAAPFCVGENLFYGKWLRGLTPEEKITSLRLTLGGEPRKWWIIFSHIHPGEDEEMMKLILEDYRVKREQVWEGAKIYYLVKK